MNYNEMVKEAYEEIVDSFEKEAGARWIKEVGKFPTWSSKNPIVSRVARTRPHEVTIKGPDTIMSSNLGKKMSTIGNAQGVHYRAQSPETGSALKGAYRDALNYAGNGSYNGHNGRRASTMGGDFLRQEKLRAERTFAPQMIQKRHDRLQQIHSNINQKYPNIYKNAF